MSAAAGTAPDRWSVTALVPGPPGQWWWQRLDEGGTPVGPVSTADVRALTGIADTTPSGHRWLVERADRTCPPLVAAGLRLSRMHDVVATERILLGRTLRHGEPASVAAVLARRDGTSVPDDPADPSPEHPVEAPTLFEATAPAGGPGSVPDLVAAWIDQRNRIGEDRALRLLVAAEGAGALAAVEMSADGVPWRIDVHRELLAELLGPRPEPGARPERLQRLAEQIGAAFGAPVNPDSPVELREAFHRVGFAVSSTRAWELQRVDHPAVAPLLQYKELARLWTANGWNWLDEWVAPVPGHPGRGRFRPGYVPAGVVSGRWAARGGGALQLPRTVRTAVRSDPEFRLVVADAAQLEPRVLAAVSRDPALQAASVAPDMYATIAAEGFGGDRARAKLALLGAMYGATSGAAGQLLPVLQRRYPLAMAAVQRAADAGELGRSVSSVLGRTCPAPDPGWRSLVEEGAQPGAAEAAVRRARSVARDRGRFTRNFLVQASAADWAAVWLSLVRQELLAAAGPIGETRTVLFQHDELVLHAPAEVADDVAQLVVDAADRARCLVFPGSPVETPVRAVVVQDYADAK
ncbi:bifunctional 3'-5' exonuclease/DNA polymerase [Nakamurella leprariae]|uniref:DNA-directed DNA polymerase n=1 Tax=Nakamurella leprariae TaxID=2803911 RepID=A0A938YIK6_9ACTN|nr:bifunctional 3'-5' exonuclease/DNA polymerase [Nakamurella leprariae]MBM9468809.1 bifunctional 3'-5' exonuclease/DNA polymerase [Nakamurella leprariae]